MAEHSGDIYRYQESLTPQTNDFKFISKQTLFTVDGNSSGGYPSGTIKFNLSSLSNSGRVLDFSNSVLVIPVVIEVTVPTAFIPDDARNCFMITMKNNCHFFNSVNVVISGHSAVEIADFSNMPINFKLLTESSFNQLNTLGDSLGFYKDNAHSIESRAASTIGIGECNNIFDDKLNTSATARGYSNDGFGIFYCNDAILKRALDTSFDVTGNASKLAGANAVGKSYCERLTSGPNTIIRYYGLVTFPLKYLNDFFMKLPLMKNSYMSIDIYTNLKCKQVVTMAAGPVFSGYNLTGNTKLCPFNITPINQGFGFAGAGDITIECGIAKTDAGTVHPVLQSCRLYTPTYVFSPEVDSQYFSQGPKRILYDAHYYTLIPNIQNTSSFNSFLVCNAVSRVRSLLIVPLANQSGIATASNVLLSPFSSCPTTTAPYAFIDNFNVRVSGTPHYPESVNYGFQHFMNEIQNASLNGGNDISLGSGLINYTDWNAGYRFIYVDLSRKEGQGVDNITKSITLDGRNMAGYAMDYHVFVFYQKELNINVSTGDIVV